MGTSGGTIGRSTKMAFGGSVGNGVGSGVEIAAHPINTSEPRHAVMTFFMPCYFPPFELDMNVR